MIMFSTQNIVKYNKLADIEKAYVIEISVKI